MYELTQSQDISQGFVLCELSNVCHTGKIFDAQVSILKFAIQSVLTTLHSEKYIRKYSKFQHVFVLSLYSEFLFLPTMLRLNAAFMLLCNHIAVIVIRAVR